MIFLNRKGDSIFVPSRHSSFESRPVSRRSKASFSVLKCKTNAAGQNLSQKRNRFEETFMYSLS
jgi:hypothetical protein